MITLEDAKKTVKAIRPEFDTFEEYKEIIIFSNSKSQGGFGGYDMPIIVMKSTGKAIGYSEFAVQHPEKLLPEEPVSEGTF